MAEGTQHASLDPVIQKTSQKGTIQTFETLSLTDRTLSYDTLLYLYYSS